MNKEQYIYIKNTKKKDYKRLQKIIKDYKDY